MAKYHGKVTMYLLDHKAQLDTLASLDGTSSTDWVRKMIAAEWERRFGTENDQAQRLKDGTDLPLPENPTPLNLEAEEDGSE